MATTQLPGQDIPIQLPDRQIEPVWYGWFKYALATIKSLLADTAGLLTKTAGYESAWTSYTPTITGTGGAVGTAVGCRYKQIGKTVHLRLGVTIGTGGSLISIALPAGMSAVAAYPSGTYLTGRENAAVGAMWVGLVGYPSLTVVTPFRYDAVAAVTAGWRIDMSGTIEIA